MSALKTVLIWVAAAFVALWLMRRLRRGERVVLKGRWSPRTVRALAILLVISGWRPGEEAQAAPPPPSDEACATLPEAKPAKLPLRAAAPGRPAIATPVSAIVVSVAPSEPLHAGDRMPWSVRRWVELKQALLGRQPAMTFGADTLSQLVRKQLDASDVARYAPERLLELLVTAEKEGRYDTILTAHAFRHVAPTASRTDLSPREQAALAELFAAAERHARVHDAVIKATAELGPVVFRPWMSKSAPPRGWREAQAPSGFERALEKHLLTATAGTWEDEATIDLEVVAGGDGARLIRYDRPVALADGARLRFQRLDLLVPGHAPLVLRHATLGTVTVPPRGAATAWNMPKLLDKSTRAAVADLVTRAKRCDRAAQAALQRTLPAAHGELRAALDGTPDAPGHGGLALLWSLFEE